MNSHLIRKIPLATPIYDKEMENAASNALLNEHFVLGETVYKFEEEFARYCGAKFAVSTNSGTAALHLSLIALGVKGQDQVITTPMSFIATANSIIHAGVTPVFADICMKNNNIDLDEIKKTITKQTAALIPVHLYGFPCEMDQIVEIAENNGLKVIEDACQAHGAEYKAQKLGTFGDVGCFSFYPSKNMTVGGDGGIVVTNNQETAEVISKLRDCGRKNKYVHDIVGYTARLNTVNAAIGRIQLKRLDEWNEKRRRHADLYTKLLSDLDEIILPPEGNTFATPVYHLYVIRVKKRDQLKNWLENNGIQCGIHYPVPIHLQPVYKELFNFKGGEFPKSELHSQTCLSIPMYPGLTRDEIKYISEKIHKFYGTLSNPGSMPKND
jgi:perosamine synthetase